MFSQNAEWHLASGGAHVQGSVGNILDFENPSMPQKPSPRPLLNVFSFFSNESSHNGALEPMGEARTTCSILPASYKPGRGLNEGGVVLTARPSYKVVL